MSDNTPAIGIALGDLTEKFLQDVLAEVDDKSLDQLNVERQLEHSRGLTGEPVTTAVLISGGAILVSAVLRIIERKLEHNHQIKTMRIVAENFQANPGLSEILADIAKKHADVSIKYGLAKEAWSGHLNER